MENMKFVFRDIEAFVNDEFNPEDPSSSVVTERTFNDHFDAGHTMLFKHADKHSRKLHEVACVTHGRSWAVSRYQRLLFTTRC